MTTPRRTKVIVTIGPATATEADLSRIREKGVDFVRVNMSHSSLEDLERALEMAARAGLSFIIDTEGSQIRTGDLVEPTIHFHENDEVTLHAGEAPGNARRLSLKPGHVVEQLEVGDLLHIDFDTLVLRIMDVSGSADGYVVAKAVSGGFVGRNKAVIVDPVHRRKYHLPTLSKKDLRAIEMGLNAGVEHVAVSFVRSGAAVEEAREAAEGRMKIISKVECVDALENLDDILDKSDFVLIDRGDLSKEIPIEKIPLTQKIIISRARRFGTGVFVATNLLETMVDKRNPTRAEVHDVIATIMDGATGLTLAAETAIGRHPMESINMLNRLIRHAEQNLGADPLVQASAEVERLSSSDYLLEHATSDLIEPHGGRLVNRVLATPPDAAELEALPTLTLNRNQQMDLEQLAIGTYSPLDGFMGEADYRSVLADMRLTSGVVWPLPITLDVSPETASRLRTGDQVALTDASGTVLAILNLREKYGFDAAVTAQQLYGTVSPEHPGVRMIEAMGSVLLGGSIDLVMGRDSDTRAYESSPRQLRRLFSDRGWARVLGFHTRNVIHRGHEFMQLKALEEENCDGLLLHPVVGAKKTGDFASAYIIKSYERMIEQFYPKEKAILAAFSTFSRYAGPREALFTALCRKNFGCSHFIVGRDHTGVGDFYEPTASQRIFDDLPEIGIEAVKFNEVFYSPQLERYVERNGQSDAAHSDVTSISGSQVRTMLERGEEPPPWLIRPEISEILLSALRAGEQVFVG